MFMKGDTSAEHMQMRYYSITQQKDHDRHLCESGRWPFLEPFTRQSIRLISAEDESKFLQRKECLLIYALQNTQLSFM